MVSLDDRLNDTVAHSAAAEWRQHVRVPSGMMALMLAVVLAAGALAISYSNGWLSAPPAERAEVTPAAGPAKTGDVMTRACARMEEIVQTACALKDYDRDREEGIQRCVAYELKYTMWSAYDCQ